MKYRLILLSAVLSLGLSVAQGWAYVGLCCAKCGGNMPMNIPGGGIPETKEWRIKVSPSLMSMSGLRDGTNGVVPGDILGPSSAGKFMAVPTSMDMRMLNLAAGYSFSDRFFGGVMLMYLEKDMAMRFNGPMATMTGVPGYTMRSSGLGDTMLMTKYRLTADDPLVPTRQSSLLFSLSLPTGSIDEINSRHPLAPRRDDALPYGMQLGSGTFDPTLGWLYQASASPWWWGVNIQGTWRLYDNKHGYQLGDRYGLDLYAMRQLRYNLLAHLQLNAERQNPIQGVHDDFVAGLTGTFNGTTDPSPMSSLWVTDNYGGDKVFLSWGFQWQPVHLQIIDLTVQTPLHQDLNGPQLKDDYRVMLTWYKEIPTRGSIRHPANLGRLSGPTESRLGF